LFCADGLQQKNNWAMTSAEKDCFNIMYGLEMNDYKGTCRTLSTIVKNKPECESSLTFFRLCYSMGADPVCQYALEVVQTNKMSNGQP
jgi:hypothetical protein